MVDAGPAEAPAAINGINGESDPSMGGIDPVVGQSDRVAGVSEPAPAIEIGLGGVYPIDRVVIVPAWRSGDAEGPFAMPKHFRLKLLSDDTDGREVRSIRAVAGPVHRDGGYPLFVDVSREDGVDVRSLRLEIPELVQRRNKQTFAIGEVMVMSDGRNVAENAIVRAKNFPSILPRWHRDFLNDGRSTMGPPIVKRDGSSEGVYAEAIDPDSRRRHPGHDTITFDLGESYRLDALRLFPIHAHSGTSLRGYAFPKRFRIEIAEDAEFQRATTIVDVPPGVEVRTDDQPLVIPLRWAHRWATRGRRGPIDGSSRPDRLSSVLWARYVRFIALEMSDHDPFRFGLAEFEIFSGDRNVAIGSDVSMPGGKPSRDVTLLTDGLASDGKILAMDVWLDRWQHVTQVEAGRRVIDRQHRVSARRADQRLLALTIGLGVLGPVTTGGWMLARRRRRQRDEQRFRQQIAMEIHDWIGTQLAAISRVAEVNQLETSGVPDELDDWGRIARLAGESTTAVHQVLRLLDGKSIDGDAHIDQVGHDRPAVMSDLQRIADEMMPHHRIRFDFGSLRECSLSRELEFCFREVMANVLKHAQANSIEVRFERDDHIWALSIRDDGIGIDRAELTSLCQTATRRHRGIENICQRMSAVGGTAEIATDDHGGTNVTLTYPVIDAANSAVRDAASEARQSDLGDRTDAFRRRDRSTGVD